MRHIYNLIVGALSVTGGIISNLLGGWDAALWILIGEGGRIFIGVEVHDLPLQEEKQSMIQAYVSKERDMNNIIERRPSIVTSSQRLKP